MRVLVCHNFYRQPGGERRAFEHQVELLRRHGDEVATLTRDSADVDRFSVGERLRFPLDTVESRRTRREVREIVARSRPDVAHVHNVFPLLSPSLYRALEEAGVPIVQSVHNYRFLCPNGLFFTHGEVCERCKLGNTAHAVRLRCYRDSYGFSALYAATLGLHRRLGTFRRIDRFVAGSPFAARKLVEGGVCGEEQVRVLGNFLAGPLPEVVPPEEPPYALFLGRLSAEKGVDLLLSAMARLPGRRLIVAGDGPAGPALRRRAAGLGLRDVVFAGFVSGAEKERLQAGAWMNVVPSLWYEMFPYSMLESAAAGVPVVVPRHGSLGSLIEEGRQGLRFAPGDADDLAATLARAFDDPALRGRLSAGARAWVEDELDPDLHYRRLTEIYREVAP